MEHACTLTEDEFVLEDEFNYSNQCQTVLGSVFAL